MPNSGEPMSETRNEPPCEHCGSRKWIHDYESGEAICGNGHVRKENVYSGPAPLRESAEGKKGMQFGTPESITSYDMGKSTVMGNSGRDASGKSLSTAMQAMIARQRKWDSRSTASSMEKNLKRALPELDRQADKINVSEAVIEKAAYTYRKALERGLIQGRSIPGMVAASLYSACRDMQVPRSLMNIARAGNLKRKDVARDYRILLKEMEMQMPVVDPSKSISQIASRARVSEKSARRGIEILAKAVELEKSAGKSPMGLAAAALYMGCMTEGEEKTQKDIAEAAGVTEVTVRNRYKDLRSSIVLELPDLSEPSASTGEQEGHGATKTASNRLIEMARSAGSPSYLEKSIVGLYAKAVEKWAEAPDSDAFLAAVIFTVMKENGEQMTYTLFARKVKVAEGEMDRYHKRIIEDLGSEVPMLSDSGRLLEIARDSGIRYPMTSYALSALRRDEVTEASQGMERDERLGGVLLAQYTNLEKIRETAERISSTTKVPAEKLVTAGITLKGRIKLREALG